MKIRPVGWSVGWCALTSTYPAHDIEWVFSQSTWIVDLTNESAKFVTNAISWCQWFSCFLFFCLFAKICLYSECDEFQSNFVLVMYPYLGHVLFIHFSFFFVHRCKIHIFKFFLWQTMELVNHSICRKKNLPTKTMDNKIGRFTIKKDNIHSHTHSYNLNALFSLLCEFWK